MVYLVVLEIVPSSYGDNGNKTKIFKKKRSRRDEPNNRKENFIIFSLLLYLSKHYIFLKVYFFFRKNKNLKYIFMYTIAHELTKVTPDTYGCISKEGRVVSEVLEKNIIK